MSALTYQEGYSDAIDYAIEMLEEVIYQWEEEVDKELLSDLKKLISDFYKTKKD
jgi:hypothetical protein